MSLKQALILQRCASICSKDRRVGKATCEPLINDITQGKWESSLSWQHFLLICSTADRKNKTTAWCRVALGKKKKRLKELIQKARERGGGGCRDDATFHTVGWEEGDVAGLQRVVMGAVRWACLRLGFPRQWGVVHLQQMESIKYNVQISTGYLVYWKKERK